MNTELRLKWIEKVLGTFSFGRRLLAWDPFSCHIKDSVTDSLKQKKVDEGLVPGRSTPYIKGPDVLEQTIQSSLYRFRRRLASKEKIDQGTFLWQSKGIPRREVVLWILAA